MDAVNAKDKLLTLLPELSTPEDLILACSLIAAQDNADVDPKKIINQLDQLAIEASEKINLSLEAKEVVKQLCHFIGNEKGFSGNTVDYYNPQNSYLNYVLLKREGIPVTLAVIYIYIAHRLGLKAEGIGFPGHFLVRIYAGADLPVAPSEGAKDLLRDPLLDSVIDSQNINSQEGLLIDPFNHVILSMDECRNRLNVLYGGDCKPEHHYFKETNYENIILRILRNLKSVFINKGDYSKVIPLCEQILFIEQDALPELLERSYALEKIQCYSAAIKDLERYIGLAINNTQQTNRAVSELDLFKAKKNLKLLRKKTNNILH